MKVDFVSKPILTKYAGPCCNCNEHVPAEGKNRGFALKENGSWNRYCRTCVPVKFEEKRELTLDGRIIMPFERSSLNLLRSIPRAWFDREDVCWKVSLKIEDRFRLLEVAEQLQLKIPEELKVSSKQKKIAEDSGLYGFQVKGVDWLSRGKYRLLADEMGLGKTVQTLMALPNKTKCLVVAPAAVKFNWKEEVQRWRPDLNPIVISGSDNFRFPSEGEVVIVNYEILPKYLEPKKKTATSKSWDVKVFWPNDEIKKNASEINLIIDEAQRVKNYKTQRSKRVRGLCMNVKSVWALTGTPLENKPQDLYGILDALQMQMQVFGGWNRFVKLMNGHQDGWGGYTWGDPSPLVPDLLRRVMLRRKRHDVLPDLPNKTYSDIKVDLPSNLKGYMDDLWDEWGNVIKDKKLPPFERFSEIRNKLATSRIHDLIDLVEDHEEENVPLVVFSAHVEPLNKISERDGWEKITGATSAERRQQIVNEFQAGNLKGVAVSIKAGGVGLTLTRAWKAVFVDLDWVPGANQQAEDRICRIGQESQKVEIVRMVSDHVMDIHVRDLIHLKNNLIEKSVEKTTEVEHPEQISETEEEFQRRMAVASLQKVSEELFFPEFVLDPMIPF